MTEPSPPRSFFRDLLLVGCSGFALLLGCAVWSILTTPRGMNAKETKAQLGCVVVDKAIREYIRHKSNPKEELPNTLQDLVQPPFGGPSLLEGGQADLIDPWGQPFQMERAKRRDGSEFIIVKTTAPDGTPISQFGVGPNSVPRLE